MLSVVCVSCKNHDELVPMTDNVASPTVVRTPPWDGAKRALLLSDRQKANVKEMLSFNEPPRMRLVYVYYDASESREYYEFSRDFIHYEAYVYVVDTTRASIVGVWHTVPEGWQRIDGLPHYQLTGSNHETRRGG